MVIKVNATYRHVFNVTREVQIDDEDFTGWAEERYGPGYDTELAIAAYIDLMDSDFLAEVFSDRFMWSCSCGECRAYNKWLEAQDG